MILVDRMGVVVVEGGHVVTAKSQRAKVNENEKICEGKFCSFEVMSFWVHFRSCRVSLSLLWLLPLLEAFEAMFIV